ncbi:MAG: hypothetical protein JST81_13655 [Bacteroidetes bacterium]|nr:hypothetical protein [Bacteroidota bacterium]
MSSKKFSFGICLSNLAPGEQINSTNKSFDFPGRHRRKWVSFISTGCHYNQVVYVIYHRPVINGVAHLHLSWQQRIVPVMVKFHLLQGLV